MQTGGVGESESGYGNSNTHLPSICRVLAQRSGLVEGEDRLFVVAIVRGFEIRSKGNILRLEHAYCTRVGLEMTCKGHVLCDALKLLLQFTLLVFALDHLQTRTEAVLLPGAVFSC